ncbi:unnamed protein product [Prorocentrum cordatum]|uniref:Uncharacterized protein n=1 Tax=Prorocentrum cordatum TaxID=2364126 RepID=A0ABN9RKA0_9DINO|nr:unnamed protein product [Polarella glacialis]
MQGAQDVNMGSGGSAGTDPWATRGAASNASKLETTAIDLTKDLSELKERAWEATLGLFKRHQSKIEGCRLGVSCVQGLIHLASATDTFEFCLIKWSEQATWRELRRLARLHDTVALKEMRGIVFMVNDRTAVRFSRLSPEAFRVEYQATQLMHAGPFNSMPHQLMRSLRAVGFKQEVRNIAISYRNVAYRVSQRNLAYRRWRCWMDEMLEGKDWRIACRRCATFLRSILEHPKVVKDQAFHQRLGADCKAVAAQEHRALPADVARSESDVLDLVYRGIFAPDDPTGHGDSSGGAAVLTPAQVAASAVPPPRDGWADGLVGALARGRIAAAHVHWGAPGGIALLSVHFHAGFGAGARSATFLRALASYAAPLQACGRDWVAIVDLNMADAGFDLRRYEGRAEQPRAMWVWAQRQPAQRRLRPPPRLLACTWVARWAKHLVRVRALRVPVVAEPIVDLLALFARIHRMQHVWQEVPTTVQELFRLGAKAPVVLDFALRMGELVTTLENAQAEHDGDIAQRWRSWVDDSFKHGAGRAHQATELQSDRPAAILASNSRAAAGQSRIHPWALWLVSDMALHALAFRFMRGEDILARPSQGIVDVTVRLPKLGRSSRLAALAPNLVPVEELGEAVRAAALASELHVRSRGGFAAPVVGRLRWADEAALLGALSTPGPKPDAFCLAAPVSLPQRESEQLAGLLGLTGALGPPLPMRVVLAWRAGRLMAAVSRGGLVPERLRLPDPEGCGPATKLVVRVTLRCLDPDLPLPEVSLSIPVGRQWVAVPLELPAAEGARAAATAAMVRGALCVLTFAAAAEPEGWRLGLAVNSLQLHAPRGGGGEA